MRLQNPVTVRVERTVPDRIVGTTISPSIGRNIQYSPVRAGRVLEMQGTGFIQIRYVPTGTLRDSHPCRHP